jgi:hypothetical protein
MEERIPVHHQQGHPGGHPLADLRGLHLPGSSQRLTSTFQVHTVHTEIDSVKSTFQLYIHQIDSEQHLSGMYT